jgi:hypothetical protein
MKGFIVQPKKPSEMIRKLKLTELVSDMNQSEAALDREIAFLSINGIIPSGTYRTYSDKTSDSPTLPYLIFKK